MTKDNKWEISSKHNQYIKLAKSLSQRRARDKEKLFIMEGLRLIEEGIRGGTFLSFVLYSNKIIKSQRGRKLLRKCELLGVPIFCVSENLLIDLADTENPQGILAVAKMQTKRLSDLRHTVKSMFLLIDGVQDPGNLGTMIRTACGAGATGVVLTKGTVDPYNPKVIRASMGMVFHIPVIIEVDNQKIIDFFKNKDFKFLVADAQGEKLYYEIKTSGPVVWALGNEANGPSDFILEAADEIVRIPLLDQVESLNVAVAAGILLFDTNRRHALLVK